nr:NUDIX domain-containing protein [Lachnospiraceae bacterium]
MYEFPCLEGHLSDSQVIGYLKEEGLSVIKIEQLPASRHIFTHKEWHMIGYAVRVDELAEKRHKAGMIFAEPGEIRDRYPIPSAYRAYRSSLNFG